MAAGAARRATPRRFGARANPLSRLPATVRAVLVFSLGLPRSFPLPFAFVTRLASSSSRSPAEPAAPSFFHARYSRSLVDVYRSVSVQCTGRAFPASRSARFSLSLSFRRFFVPRLGRSAAVRGARPPRRWRRRRVLPAATPLYGPYDPPSSSDTHANARAPLDTARATTTASSSLSSSLSSSSSLASSSSSSSSSSFLPSVADVRFRSSRSSSSSCCAVVVAFPPGSRSVHLCTPADIHPLQPCCPLSLPRPRNQEKIPSAPFRGHGPRVGRSSSSSSSNSSSSGGGSGSRDVDGQHRVLSCWMLLFPPFFFYYFPFFRFISSSRRLPPVPFRAAGFRGERKGRGAESRDARGYRKLTMLRVSF